MLFDWNTYKDLAEVLRLRDDEASKRAAISRLYYSVFHQAKIFLIDIENYDYSENKEPHAQVWNEFIRKGKTYKSIGENGKRLRNIRNNADYDDEIIRLDDVLETSFRTATNVLTYLQQIQKNVS
jgi:uncharacterized protein (UPF0332 family)